MFKRDLFNIADLLAVSRKHPGALFVQHTTQDKVNNRIQKIAGLAQSRTIIAAGNRIHVHGWKAKGGKGKPKTWEMSVNIITFDKDGLIEVCTQRGDSVGEQEALAFEPDEQKSANPEEDDDPSW